MRSTIGLATASGVSCRPVAGIERDDAGRLPGEFAALETATRVVLELAGGADEWDAATRATVLSWLGRHRDRMVLVEARVLTAEREAGTWGLSGDRDLATFAGRRSGQGRGAGMAQVHQAEMLAELPAVAEALADGPVTVTHLARLARATAESPLLAAALATPEGQAHVVELAGRLDGAEFGTVLRQEAASLDPAARQRSHDEQRAKRSFVLTRTPGGTLFKGFVDSIAGHKLQKAIDALDPRPATDDERTREMRQADALMAMVERTLADKRTTPDAKAPVQAIVTFDQATWVALRAGDADPEVADGPGADGRPCVDGPGGLDGRSNGDGRPAKGSAADAILRLRGAAPVTDETAQAWAASEIGRALCDCSLTRVVLDAAGRPLDVGRDERLFTRAHWLALYAAGQRTCAVAGCGMPLVYTELHHLRWWARHGGGTDLANCAPYCSFHHHEIHRWGIAVSRRPDGTYEHRHPDGRLYGGASPGPGRDGRATPRSSRAENDAPADDEDRCEPAAACSSGRAARSVAAVRRRRDAAW